MALTDDQKHDEAVLQSNMEQTGVSIQDMTGQIDGQSSLSKLATGGQKPDYDRISTEDLMKMYDGGVRSSTINTLSDGIDPVSQLQVAPPHPHSVLSTAERGQLTAEMTRQEMIDGIDAVLEAHGYDYDPQKIATAQGMSINAQAAELEGRVEKCNLAYIKMQEDIPGYKNEGIEARLKELKAEAAEFSKLAEVKCAGYVHSGLDQKLTHLSATGGSNAQQAAKAIETAKQGLDPTNLSGGTKHMGKLDPGTQQLDMSNMNLKNVDLSQSDLTGVKVDPKGLSEAKGLDRVKGLDPEIKAEALGLKRLQQLEDQKAKLQNPSITDRLKGLIKHGTNGVSGEIKSIDKKIEATKEAMDRSLNKGMSVDDQREVVNQFKGLDQKMAQEIAAAHNAGGQLAASNALDVKSKDDYSADDKQLGKLAAREETLKTDRESVKDALKKESRVLKAMEKIDAPKESKSVGRKV